MKKFNLLIFSLLACVSVQAQLPLYHEDQFNDNKRGWRIASNEKEITSISNGHYNLEFLKEKGGKYYTQIFALNPQKDFVIEAVITQVESVDDYGFGITWGYQDANNCYGFIICADGNAKVYNSYEKETGGETEAVTEDIKKWTKTTFVKPNGEPNTLKIERKKSTLTFYINGNLFHTCPFMKLYGLKAGIETNRRMKVKVDRLSLYQEWPAINLAADASLAATRVKMDQNVNTKYDEKFPRLSPDGKYLFICRDECPENIGNPEKEDVWFSEWKDGNWTKMKNLGTPINNNTNNSVISVTADNNVLLINGQYNADGSYKKGALSMSYRTEKGWSLPEDVSVENYYNNSDYEDVCMSSNRKVLIMTLDREGTLGMRDLYVCFLKNDGINWSKPKHMGSVLNTFADEAAPFLAPDGVTLYYATAGKRGYGDKDIFVSRRLDDSWTKWSEPQNLGPNINSPDWDSHYSIAASGDFAILCSYDSETGDDLYMVKIPKSIKPNPVVIISGKVFDAKTKKPLGVNISYEKLPDGTEAGIAYSQPSTGDYKIVLPYGATYGFHAKAKGYISVNENLELVAVKEFTEMKHDLYLVPIEIGQSVQLKNVFFKQSLSEMLPSSFPELNRLIQILKDNPTLEIELSGHTDNQGDATKNLLLSEQRVAAVKDYLVKGGIEASRIKGKGYGGSKPIASNTTEETRKQNRRVEFVIIKQ